MRNYIIVGRDLSDRSMMLRIAHQGTAPRKKSFANDESGRFKMIRYLHAQAKKAGGARIRMLLKRTEVGKCSDRGSRPAPRRIGNRVRPSRNRTSSHELAESCGHDGWLDGRLHSGRLTDTPVARRTQTV